MENSKEVKRYLRQLYRKVILSANRETMPIWFNRHLIRDNGRFALSAFGKKK